MVVRKLPLLCLPSLLLCLSTGAATAQSFRVQCPATTTLHPAAVTGVTPPPGAIKCQQISGGDGFATMADGHQIFLFGFGPLSGLSDLANGLPGTEPASIFNTVTDPNGAVIDPASIMNTGVLNAESPAPLMAIDEDDEFFLTLTNVGMIMRPDLFEQHTVHFHGYPNASSFFDGVPDASVAINIGGSFTYYYTAPDAGTYFWHCHISPPEHLQMGMVGQLYVRPRQNKVAVGSGLYAALKAANTVKGKSGVGCTDLLCTGQTPLPGPTDNGVLQAVDPFAGIDPRIPAGAPLKYAYNDGDGSTRYDVEYPIQIMGFDPNFHFVGTTFNPEGFADMKDRYFLLSGRGYPDTVNTTGYVDSKAPVGTPVGTTAIYTEASDGTARPSQPLSSLIVIPHAGRALLRISDLSVTEFSTLATIGIPMQVVGFNARLLRDMSGNNLYYKTNSITLGGGESIDVMLDANGINAGTYFLYTTNLDHLSNDAENFGGQMTEIHVQ